MSKSGTKDVDAVPKKRPTRFVPTDDVPAPGLSPRAREVLGLALCGFALYGLLCLATFSLANLDGEVPSGGMQNLGGAVGYHIALAFTISLGLAGWIPFVMLLLGSIWLFFGRPLERVTIKLLGTVVFAAMIAILLAGADGQAIAGASTPFGSGGNFGKFLSPRLESAFGPTGRLLLVGFGALMALLIATEWLFSQLVLRTVATFDAMWRRLWRRPAAAAAGAGGAATVFEPAEDGVPAKRARGEAKAAKVGSRDAVDADDAPAATVAAADVAATAATAAETSSAKSGRRRSRKARADSADAAGAGDADELDGLGSVGAGDDADDLGADDLDASDALAKPSSKGARAAAAAADDRDEAGGVDGDDAPDRSQRQRSKAAAGEVRAAAEPPAAADQTVLVPTPPPGEPAAAAPVPAPPPIVVLKPKPKPKPKPAKVGQTSLPFEGYPFPPFELFQEPQLNDATTTADVLTKGGAAIVNKLAHFGIQAEIVAASVGPAVTQYELRLAESIRVNKVAGFESDLAAALKAVSVRVVAPIPGKDTIGIEVPNQERQKVFMRDLLDQYGRSEQLAIPLYLGKDVAGNPIVEDLAKMPHLLIAGTTGSGKSVCINTILLSVLMTRTPEQVKLILVDPKMVELQAYKKVPHLCCDVVTNMKKAPGVLQWAVDEMENRYGLLSAVGVNHIRNYNRIGQQELAKRLKREPDPERVQLPYVVIVIDEFADLMNVAQNEVEELIQRLAQKSRAVGMHVILATQRPSSEVITGVIKANLPCQIAFKVNRRIDSRVILDANGAEKLLGFGDMLYMPPGGGALLRAQGTFVADDEMQAVVRYLEEHGQEPSFTPSLVQTQGSSRAAIADRDERYREAVEIILGQQRGSATLLQRALGVGYTRATRLLELMEEDGLVGPFVGSKSRDVLLTIEEYRTREEQRELMADDAAAAAGDADNVDAVAAPGDPDGEVVPAAGEMAPLAAAAPEAAQDGIDADEDATGRTAAGDS